MEKLVIRFLAVVFALFVAEYIVPGVTLHGLYAASVVAVLLGALNLFVRPILIVLTLPITILTFGLFVFVINACIFLFLGTIVKGFEVSGFIPALLASLVVSLVSSFIQKLT